LYLSHVIPEKGIFDLIAAIRLLGSAAAAWEVRIVGEASRESSGRLKAEVASLKEAEPKIRVLGAITGRDKAAQYSWANAFVFPARQDEGQPLVLLEAMSAGLPIVATRQPGIADTVRDGEDGLLFERGNITELAGALARLGRDPDLARALGASGRRRYEQLFTPSRLRTDLLTALRRDPILYEQ
jgi:glycosyltransferase involved in cell wall biosynthesis